MKLLVIGGAGYIGAHVVHDLVEEGHHVIVYDNLFSGFKENLPGNCNFIQGDILNKTELLSALKQDIDAVFHFAAKKAAGESMVDVRSFSQTNISPLKPRKTLFHRLPWLAVRWTPDQYYWWAVQYLCHPGLYSFVACS